MKTIYRTLGCIAAMAVCLNAADVSRIYVLTTFHGTKITTYTPEGQRIEPTIALPPLSGGPIAVSPSGTIYTSSCYPEQHFRAFNPDGSPAPLFPGVAGCSLGITFDAGGMMYILGGVRDVAIRTYTERGLVGTFEPNPVRESRTLAINANGKIHVAFQNLKVVKTYDAGGHETTPTMTHLDTPHFIAIGPDGNFHIADAYAVLSLTPDGQLTAPRLMHQNPMTGGVFVPLAVAVDASGRIYVDWGSVLMSIYQPDGTLIREFPLESGTVSFAVH
jgi:hypothetical protein